MPWNNMARRSQISKWPLMSHKFQNWHEVKIIPISNCAAFCQIGIKVRLGSILQLHQLWTSHLYVGIIMFFTEKWKIATFLCCKVLNWINIGDHSIFELQVLSNLGLGTWCNWGHLMPLMSVALLLVMVHLTSIIFLPRYISYLLYYVDDALTLLKYPFKFKLSFYSESI